MLEYCCAEKYDTLNYNLCARICFWMWCAAKQLEENVFLLWLERHMFSPSLLLSMTTVSDMRTTWVVGLRTLTMVRPQCRGGGSWGVTWGSYPSTGENTWLWPLVSGWKGRRITVTWPRHRSRGCWAKVVWTQNDDRRRQKHALCGATACSKPVLKMPCGRKKIIHLASTASTGP